MGRILRFYQYINTKQSQIIHTGLLSGTKNYVLAYVQTKNTSLFQKTHLPLIQVRKHTQEKKTTKNEKKQCHVLQMMIRDFGVPCHTFPVKYDETTHWRY